MVYKLTNPFKNGKGTCVPLTNLFVFTKVCWDIIAGIQS